MDKEIKAIGSNQKIFNDRISRRKADLLVVEADYNKVNGQKAKIQKELMKGVYDKVTKALPDQEATLKTVISHLAKLVTQNPDAGA